MLSIAIFVFGTLLRRRKEYIRPLFTIAPTGVTVPALGVTAMVGLVLVATLLASAAAGASLRRIHLVDVLREE